MLCLLDNSKLCQLYLHPQSYGMCLVFINLNGNTSYVVENRCVARGGVQTPTPTPPQLPTTPLIRFGSLCQSYHRFTAFNARPR